MENNNSEGKSNLRGHPKDAGPYCWQAKSALRKIRDQLDTNALSGLAVYVALCEISSDMGGINSFDAPHLDLMAKSGVKSSRTVKDRLKDLQSIGLVHIRENSANGLKRKSTYSLLAIGNDYPSIGNRPPPVHYLSTKEESERKVTSSLPLKKNKEKKGARPFAGDGSSDSFQSIGYGASQAAKLALYDSICVRAALGFLPVDQWNQKLCDFLDANDREALQAIFERFVEMERAGEWGERKKKTLRGIMEDAGKGRHRPKERANPQLSKPVRCRL